MADEISRTETNLPAAPPLMNVTASGDGTAIGIVQGDVRFELNENSIPFIQRMVGCQQPEFHAAEWALLNEKCFHLFVLENEKYDCGCFSISKRVALTKNTSPEYIEHYNPLTSTLIQELLNMPCLFTMRNPNFKEAPRFYPALIGKLTAIIPQGDCIKFKFYHCGRLPQQFINENMHLFHLIAKPVRNQLDEEHWSIRTGNLVAIVDQLGIEIQ